MEASKRSIKPNGTPDINTHYNSSHSAVMFLHMKDQGKWCPRAWRKLLVDNRENIVPHGSHTTITQHSGKMLVWVLKSMVSLCMCMWRPKIGVSCRPQSFSTLIFETEPLSEFEKMSCPAGPSDLRVSASLFWDYSQALWPGSRGPFSARHVCASVYQLSHLPIPS